MTNVTLRFRNRDASGELEDISLSVDRTAVSHIMAWYGAYCAGDDYDVFVNGRKQAMDQNGEFEPITLVVPDVVTQRSRRRKQILAS